MLRAALTLVFVGGVAAVSAQTPGPVFDVVSIRHDPGGRCCLNNETERPGGGFSFVQGSIAALIGRAYGVLPMTLRGCPNGPKAKPTTSSPLGALRAPPWTIGVR